MNESLKHFFPDGKTVIVPIDHGTAIPVPGLEHPSEVIESLKPWADGFVVNAGILSACQKALEGKGICLRTDVYKPPASPYRIYDTEDALSLGAHAVMNMLYPENENEADIVRECAYLIQQGRDTGVPSIIEALPYNLGVPHHYTVENISFAVRMSAEIGADVVKTAFPTGGTRDDFARIVDACPVPVIVLGGAQATDDKSVLAMAADAISAGAKGVAIGRNVWQHASPPKMAKALHEIVHAGASAESVTSILN